MIPTLGYFSLIIAMASALVMGIAPIWQKEKARVLLKWLSFTVFGTIGFSFLCLVYSFAVSDFSVLTVAMNSHTAKPLIYKISGTWGNHEGSMLLWVLSLATFTAGFSLLSKTHTHIKTITLAAQGFVIAGFLSFILFTSNPFARLFPTPDNGLGLNPLLQDIGLALHPPMLYAGYVGFSIGFSAAIALLLSPNENASEWAKKIKPWVLVSWAFLNLGIGLGSWWAYRELGWGGFWFWDPVENASLMPWISGTALIHSLLILEKRDALKRWCILLAIITFSLSLIGTFLVRSGVLTSVHAFANDPSRGIFILALLGITILVSLSLFALYAPKIKSTSRFSLFSREGMILINNLLLLTACATVVLGTLYPLLLEVLTGEHITVGAPYFNSTVNIIALPITFLMFIGTAIAWSQGSMQNLAKKSILPLAGVVVTVLVLWFARLQASALTITAISLSAWLISGTLWLAVKRLINDVTLTTKFNAMVLAHCGFGFLVLGIAVTSQWQQEKEAILQIGKTLSLAHYEAKLDQVEVKPEENYITRRGIFSVTLRRHCEEGNFTRQSNPVNDTEEKEMDCRATLRSARNDGKVIATLKPETRFYPIKNTQTTESAIYTNLFSNLYIALGEVDEKGNIAARIYYKPGINLIWLGGLLMTIGGGVALVKRRRV